MMGNNKKINGNHGKIIDLLWKNHSKNRQDQKKLWTKYRKMFTKTVERSTSFDRKMIDFMGILWGYSRFICYLQ